VDDGPAELSDLVMRVARTQRRRWRDVLAPWDLSPHHARALRVISAHDGMRLTDLAEQARVTKQTAGALIDQLERAGYVARAPDPSDARARLVTLTDKGLALCRTAGKEVDKVEKEWREFLGERRFIQMHDALVALREITDPYR
jgi:DNA-binding MarR family transcriptional regulator